MAALTCLLAIAMSRYRFRGQVNRETASALMAFARPMFLSRGLEIGLERIDRLIVGSLMGNVQLGFYHQARVLAEAGLVATRPLSRISFNLYSRLQHESDRLTSSYRIVGFFLVRVSFAGSTTLLVFPGETVRLLLGEEWLSAAPILSWLAVYAGMMPLFENLKVLAYGRAKMRPIVMLRAAQLALLAAGTTFAAMEGEILWVAGVLAFVLILGLGIVMRSSSDWVQTPDGKWGRAQVQQTRGLNRNHNSRLKGIFKGAAMTVITHLTSDPLHDHYLRLTSAGTKPNLAKLTIARRVAAIVLRMWKDEKEYDPSKLKQQERLASAVS